MQDVDLLVVGGEFVGDLPGAVGAVVVGDQYVGLRDGCADPGDDGREIVGLVVRRDDHQRGSERAVLLARGR